MKVVIQRVKRCSICVQGTEVSNILSGICVYLGIEDCDILEQAQFLARKVANLRIFEDCEGKMNHSLLDYGGEVMLIPQFTLIGDCTKGNRPDFTKAAKPKEANDLYIAFGKLLEDYGLKVSYGVFGADMRIEQINDGPVTIIIEK